MIIDVPRSSGKVPGQSFQILMTFELCRRGLKKQLSNLMKIRPVGVELFHADRQTDTTKLMAAFLSFANVARK